MSKTYIPVKLRREVEVRADDLCEYCRINKIFTGLPFAIDHIIGESHGGLTTLENLAFACAICNHFKHANLAAFLPDTGEVVRLFHPRQEDWSHHFQLKENGEIAPLTKIGAGTIRLLKMNRSEAIEERRLWNEYGFK